MCLIAYSPKGKPIERSVLAYAHNQNNDGIGIMSALGIEKYLGRKALKRARRYIETYLVPKEIPFAIHFRWATHGEVGFANTHPYESPTGQHWVMHNGIISCTTQESSAKESDTAVFVRKYMQEIPAFDHATYFDDIERKIQWGNKLCIMDSNGTFKLCNEDAGVWIDGIWFSNTYSLPAFKVPRRLDYGDWKDGWRSTTYVPRTVWDYTEHKMVPNPLYKADDDSTATVIIQKDATTRTQSPFLLPRPASKWSHEDRRGYYEALEAGLTVETDYYDAGVLGETAATNAVLDAEEKLAEMAQFDKEEAAIGGDFAPEEDAEDQNMFRRYLKKVAAGIYSS